MTISTAMSRMYDTIGINNKLSIEFNLRYANHEAWARSWTVCWITRYSQITFWSVLFPGSIYPQTNFYRDFKSITVNSKSVYRFTTKIWYNEYNFR